MEDDLGQAAPVPVAPVRAIFSCTLALKYIFATSRPAERLAIITTLLIALYRSTDLLNNGQSGNSPDNMAATEA